MRTLRKTEFKLLFKACEQGRMRNQAKTNWGVKVMQVGQLLQLREGAARHRAGLKQLLPALVLLPQSLGKGWLTGGGGRCKDSRHACVSCCA